MKSFSFGQFVYLDGSGVGITVMLPHGSEVPEDHIGVWFGTTTEAGNPLICTIPAEYLISAPDPVVQH